MKRSRYGCEGEVGASGKYRTRERRPLPLRKGARSEASCAAWQTRSRPLRMTKENQLGTRTRAGQSAVRWLVGGLPHPNGRETKWWRRARRLLRPRAPCPSPTPARPMLFFSSRQSSHVCATTTPTKIKTNSATSPPKGYRRIAVVDSPAVRMAIRLPNEFPTDAAGSRCYVHSCQGDSADEW